MNVFQRLNEVRKEVAYIRKDKKVENYVAVTHDQVTAETRDSFITHGVLIIPHEIESSFKETGAVSAKGTPSMRFEAKYRIDFVNIDDPKDICSVDFSAHALDFGDKAPGKAHSYATKYAILKVLQIETGEDEEGRQTTSGAAKELIEFERVAEKLAESQDLATDLKNLPGFFNGDKDKATRFWQLHGKTLKDAKK